MSRSQLVLDDKERSNSGLRGSAADKYSRSRSREDVGGSVAQVYRNHGAGGEWTSGAVDRESSLTNN